MLVFKFAESLQCVLNGKLIIDVCDSIQFTLVNIFKTSLEEAVFPEKLKIAIIPDFKKGENENVDNYQPISILPIFSKVLECVNNLPHENQFGFQINNSTEHVIMQFIRDMVKTFDNGRFTLVH